MVKFTPGPWVTNRVLPKEPAVYSDKHIVADCAHNDKFTLDEALANARLIAAAPELLEACKAIVKADYDGCTTSGKEAFAMPALAQAIAAIEKAEGWS